MKVRADTEVARARVAAAATTLFILDIVLCALNADWEKAVVESVTREGDVSMSAASRSSFKHPTTQRGRSSYGDQHGQRGRDRKAPVEELRFAIRARVRP